MTGHTIGDLIPGKKFKQLSSQGSRRAKGVTVEESSPTQELRRLAFDFPMELPQKFPKSESSVKKSGRSKCKKEWSRSHWGNEEVDDSVKRVLGRKRVWKQERKRKKVFACFKECSNTSRSLGKEGRGETPHEYWEEERRKRERRAKEKIAKEEKKGVNTMIENLIDDLLSATRISNKHKQVDENMSLMTDGSSGEEKTEYANSSEGNLAVATDQVSMSETSCEEEVFGRSSCGSEKAGVYLKELGSNNVININNKDQKEFPNLTSDSETETGSEEEETEGYISDREGHQEAEEKDQQDWVSIYFKDWESNNVFQLIKDLTMLHCQSEVTDSDSQCGDDESEDEEKVQRRKSLPRSKGGAGQWRWQKETVEIAIQVHSERNYIWLKTFFYRLLLNMISD